MFFSWRYLLILFAGIDQFQLFGDMLVERVDIRRIWKRKCRGNEYVAGSWEGPRCTAFSGRRERNGGGGGGLLFVYGDPACDGESGVPPSSAITGRFFFSFRGGKGIATTVGVTALLTFQAALVSGIFAVLAILLTRYVSLGSLVFTTLLPILIGWMDYPPAYFLISLIITLLAYLRHRDNIKRLLQGKEHRIGVGNDGRG